jgi:riboflavin biosynthesis pyrimidine reductase
VRQIYPVQGPDLPLAIKPAAGPLPAAVAELARLYGNGAAAGPAEASARRWLRANMVASVDGAATVDGRSGGLSGAADRTVFTVLRSVADVVLVGASTARTEHYGPIQPDEIWTALRPAGAALPPIAVVTGTLNLSSCSRLLTLPPGPSQTIVITTSTAPADRKAELAGRARIIEAGTHRVDMRVAIRELTSLGHASILTEGGPTLLAELAGAGLLDELCLTTSPLLAGGQASRIVSSLTSGGTGSGAHGLSLAHVLADAGFLLCRYLAA